MKIKLRKVRRRIVRTMRAAARPADWTQSAWFKAWEKSAHIDPRNVPAHQLI